MAAVITAVVGRLGGFILPDYAGGVVVDFFGFCRIAFRAIHGSVSMNSKKAMRPMTPTATPARKIIIPSKIGMG